MAEARRDEIEELRARVSSLEEKLGKLTNLVEGIEKKLSELGEVRKWLERGLNRRFMHEFKEECVHLDKEGYCTLWYWKTRRGVGYEGW